MGTAGEPVVYQLRVVLEGISPLIWRRLTEVGNRIITHLHLRRSSFWVFRIFDTAGEFIARVLKQTENLLKSTLFYGGLLCRFVRNLSRPFLKKPLALLAPLFPKAIFICSCAGEIGVLFDDADFAALFPTRGQPAYAPWRLALITILQFVENLSDRAASESVRARIDLRRVVIQQFYTDENGIHWRTVSEGTPPSIIFINSPYDLEAHYGKKRSLRWAGYKIYLTETCNEKSPRLITNVETSSAPIADFYLTEPIHRALKKKNLLPAMHSAGTGFVDAELILAAEQNYNIDLLGPSHLDRQWQSRHNPQFCAENFFGAQVIPYSNELQVTADTPPAFLVHAVTDAAVPLENSLLVAEAWR